MAATATWNITSELAGDILGGKATVLLNYYQIGQKSFVFYIRGQNPSISTVWSDPAVWLGPWFMKALIRHESSTYCGNEALQFNNVGTLGPGWGDYKHCPNRSSDGKGWGLMQLTPPDSRRQLWDWKENLWKGADLLQQKNSESTSVWNTSLQSWWEWRDLHPDSPPPEPDTYGSCNFTFAQPPVVGGYSFGYAVWIKLYNGRGGGYYLIWNDTAHEWEKNKLNNLGFNYVERVINQYCDCPG